MSEKKKYEVCYVGEDFLIGEIYLTKEQADIISYALNPDNWSNVDGNPEYCGTFGIKPAE